MDFCVNFLTSSVDQFIPSSIKSLELDSTNILPAQLPSFLTSVSGQPPTKGPKGQTSPLDVTLDHTLHRSVYVSFEFSF